MEMYRVYMMYLKQRWRFLIDHTVRVHTDPDESESNRAMFGSAQFNELRHSSKAPMDH